jgi:hypothetical protein
MPATRARVVIATPARYMARLCNHFAHRVTVQREADHARVEFSADAFCAMQATAEHLTLGIEAADAATLDRLEEVVGRHLKQVASAETFEIRWVRA